MFTESQKKTIKDFAGEFCALKFLEGTISCDFAGTKHEAWGRQEFYTPESFFKFFVQKIYQEFN